MNPGRMPVANNSDRGYWRQGADMLQWTVLRWSGGRRSCERALLVLLGRRSLTQRGPHRPYPPREKLYNGHGVADERKRNALCEKFCKPWNFFGRRTPDSLPRCNPKQCAERANRNAVPQRRKDKTDKEEIQNPQQDIHQIKNHGQHKQHNPCGAQYVKRILLVFKSLAPGSSCRCCAAGCRSG